MSYISIHGIHRVEGHVWPPHKYVTGPYVSIKIKESSRFSEVTIFTSSLSELDALIDTVSTMRRELAMLQTSKDQDAPVN